jgi:hypothetical protein
LTAIDWRFAFRPLTTDVLRKIRALPNLTALSLPMGTPQHQSALLGQTSGDAAVHLLRSLLPPTLRVLTLALSVSPILLTASGALLTSLSVLQELRTLNLAAEFTMSYLPSLPPDALPLDALVELPHLHRLDLQVGMGTAALFNQPRNVCAFKQLRHLREFKCSSLQVIAAPLFTSPHQLCALESLVGLSLHESAAACTIGSLPSLTRLRPGTLHPAGWAQLCHLTKLRVLNLNYNGAVNRDQLHSLPAALVSCPQLEELWLSSWSAAAVPPAERASFWPALFDATPALEQLYVSYTHAGTLLDAACSRLPALVKLDLEVCSGISVASIRAFTHPTLRQFTLHSRDGVIDDISYNECQSLRHSSRFPRLAYCMVCTIQDRD